MVRTEETARSVCPARFDGGRRIGTRTFVTGVLGLISGFVTGILLFDHGPGMDLLPIVLALVCAVAAPIADARFRRDPGRP